ncbi:MAG: TolC family protein [Candidatus Latescibacteria bacterium]|nr:TolC family protein [Candidatus Latescibacterota bacterium]
MQGVFVRGLSQILAVILILAHLTTPPPLPCLTLDEAIQRALENSPDLRRAQSNRNAVRQTVSQATGRYLPQVTFSLNYGKGRNAFELPDFGPGGATGGSTLQRFDISNPFRTQVSVSVPLYTGGALSGQVHATRAALRAADQTVKQQRQTMVLRVRETYYGVLRATDLVKASVSSVERARELYRVTSKKFDAGVRPRSDVLRAEVAMASAERNFLLATNALELARSALNDAIGRDLNALVEVEPPSLEPQELMTSVDEDIARATRDRPELQALREQAAGLEGTVRAARSALLPGAALTGDYAVADTHPSASPDRSSWVVGGALRWVVFDGAVSLSRYRETLYAQEGARQAVEALQRRIALEVKQAYLGVREAFDRISLADRQVRSAQESFRNIEAAYREGMAVQVDMLDAQASLSAAEAEAAVARYDHLIAWARYQFAIGAE